MGFDQPSLKGRALRLLAAREHSRAELEKRLAEHETEPGELARVLDELQARGFIDEQRVVDSVLHRRAPRMGAARVRQELQSRGLDAEAVAAAVAQLQDTELARAQAVWQKKFGEPPSDPKERARQMRFLLSRGFAAAVVQRVLNGAGGEDLDIA